VKSFIARFLTCLSAVGLSLAAVADAPAQQGAKPVIVVSISSLNEMFGDIAAMTELAGQADFGRIAVGMGGIYTGGVDKTRPAGVVVSLDGTEPKVVAFVPVTNLKQFLGTHRETIGNPKDVGNGVLEIGSDRPQPAYVKEQDGWAYIGQSPTQFQNLPKDPSVLLGGLHKQYDIAVQVNMANLPAELRDLAVTQMKQGYKAAMETQNRNLDPNERKQAEMIGDAMLQSMTMFIEETEQLTLGFAIDGQAKKTFLEFGMTARPGTQLAKAMTGYGTTPSSMHGFVLPGSAASFIGAAPLSASDIEQGKALLAAARQQAMTGIDNDAGLPNAEARDSAKDIVGTLFDVLGATVAKGKMDLAGSVKLASKSLTLVGGVGVADGDKIEPALKKLVAMAGNGADIPEVKFNIATYAGVNLHKVVVSLNQGEQQVREIFGEKLEVFLGTAKDGLYLALGKDGEATLRASLDASAQQKNKPAPSAELQVSLSPILKFASSVESDPQLAQAAATSEKFAGKDHVIMNSRPVDRGFIYRLEIEEGIVQFVGEAIKAAQAAQQR